MSYKQLVIGFVRSGVLGYGGGPSVIPLIRFESVDNYKWMDDDEFGDILAMANALPGPIATKMAAYIGYRVKGALGAVVAILAHIIPSVLAMIFLLTALYKMKDSPYVQGMISAISPVIGVMLGVMGYEFFEKAWKGLGWLGATILIIASAILLEVINIHPAIVIVLFVTLALLQAAIRRKRKQSVAEATAQATQELQPQVEQTDGELRKDEQPLSQEPPEKGGHNH